MASPRFDREVAAVGRVRSNLAVAMLLREVDTPPCPYPEHRAADWRLDDEHPSTCGICHPRASELRADWEARHAA